MRVCLVRPPAFVSAQTYPYNLECLTAALEAEGHEVSWVDADAVASRRLATLSHRRPLIRLLDGLFLKRALLRQGDLVDAVINDLDEPLWSAVSEAVLASRPEVVGFSCYSASMSATLLMVKHLRQRCQVEVPIVLGGIHPTTAPVETLARVPGADYVVIGEGEATLRELLEALAGGGDVSRVAGLGYRVNGDIRITAPRGLIADLSSLPVAAFRNAGPEYAAFVTLTSRGCPYNCHYCASKRMWTRKVRFRPPEQVVREIVNLRGRVKLRRLRFGDDTFTLNKGHIREVAGQLRAAGIDDLELSVGSRIDTMDRERLAMLKEMGVTTVSFGVESGSERVLRGIDKNIRPRDVVPTVKMVNEEGIFTITFFIINHPGETVSDMKKTLALIRALKEQCRLNTVSVNTGFPYPATPWWDFCESGGLSSGIDFYTRSHHYNHQLSPVVNMTAEPAEVLSEMKRCMDGLELRYNLAARARKGLRLLLRDPRGLGRKLFPAWE